MTADRNRRGAGEDLLADVERRGHDGEHPGRVPDPHRAKRRAVDVQRDRRRRRRREAMEDGRAVVTPAAVAVAVVRVDDAVEEAFELGADLLAEEGGRRPLRLRREVPDDFLDVFSEVH